MILRVKHCTALPARLTRALQRPGARHLFGCGVPRGAAALVECISGPRAPRSSAGNSKHINDRLFFGWSAAEAG
jgi:hypothetical protein